MIIFYVPCKDKTEAKKIAIALLKKKLVVCANIVPSQTIYAWEGKIVEEKEEILIVKTINRQEEATEKEIKKLHSYEIPAIIKMTAKVNEEYLEWAESVIE